MKISSKPCFEQRHVGAAALVRLGPVGDEDVQCAHLRLGSSHSCSDSSTPNRASSFTRPSFKIQLPPPRYSPLTSSGVAQSHPYRSFLTAEHHSPSATVLDSPDISEQRQAPHVIITPFATPADEKILIMSANEIVSDLKGSSEVASTSSSNIVRDLEGRDEASSISGNNIVSDLEGRGEVKSLGNDTVDSLSYGSDAWLENAIHMTVSSNAAASGNETIKLVAQTLPEPIAFPEPKPNEPTIFQTTAFPPLMNALQAKASTNSIEYIHITQAVPTGFNLNSLPSSPASTPGPSNAQGDYFTSKIINSAVAFANRHDNYTKGNEHAPSVSSPMLAVPPSSTDFGLLERYIPPSSSQEFTDLFSVGGPSALTDRLAELSPFGGTLLFIYPTKTGAEKFKKEYLSPILDPVLRSVATRNGLSLDICRDLGTMTSVEHLVPFEGLKRKVAALLARYGRNAVALNKPLYSLLYASKALVPVHQKMWKQWYNKQESPKIRHITTQYLTRARQATGNAALSQVLLMREILDGLEQRDYETGEGPEEGAGLEVGVFVIKRTQ